MKAIARSLVWWPNIDQDIQALVQHCQQCHLHQNAPAPSHTHSWMWPECPWERLHIDHAGPFIGKYFLVVVDAHSKWLEATIVPSTSTHATVQNIFATHGLPAVLVSDNGTCFTSSGVYGKEWHPAFNFSPIPPCNKWPRREGCSNTQECSEKATVW